MDGRLIKRLSGQRPVRLDFSNEDFATNGDDDDDDD